MKNAVFITYYKGWYEKRLRPIAEILLKSGYKITIITSDYEKRPEKPVFRTYKECMYIKVPYYNKNFSLTRIWSHLYFGKCVNRFIKKNKPDFIYALLPPNNYAKYCLKYKEKNQKVIYFIDIFDLWPESMPLGILNRTPPAWIWSKMRNDSIKAADHVFLECELYKEKLRNVLKEREVSILHLFKEQTCEEKKLIHSYIKRQKEEQKDNLVRIAYLGSINNIIDIDGICRVIKTISIQKKVYIYIIGGGEGKAFFLSALSEIDCEVFDYGEIYDEIEKIKILLVCDYGFNMMKQGVSVGLSMKSIDYFSYGLPIINNIKGDTWRLVNIYGVGVNIDAEFKELPTINHEKVYECFQMFFTQKAFEKKAKIIMDKLIR